MNRIAVFFSLMALLPVQTSQGATVDLQVNGGAESGAVDPWLFENVGVYQSQKETAGIVTPAQGLYFFSMAPQRASFAWMAQQGPIDPGACILTFSGMVQTESLVDDDYGRAFLSIYDANDVLLDSVTSLVLTTDNLQWRPFAISLPIPPRAHRWRVRLEGTRLYGSYINVFYDGLKLESRTFTTDFVPDCKIDLLDFAALAGAWLTNDPRFDVAPEPAGDDIVNLLDLESLASEYLQHIK